MKNIWLMLYLALVSSPVWLTVLLVWVNQKLLDEGSSLFKVIDEVVNGE